MTSASKVCTTGSESRKGTRNGLGYSRSLIKSEKMRMHCVISSKGKKVVRRDTIVEN